MESLSDKDIKKLEDLHLGHQQPYYPPPTRPLVPYQGSTDDFAPPVGPPPGSPPGYGALTKASNETSVQPARDTKEKKIWGISSDKLMSFAAGAAVGSAVGGAVGYKIGKHKGKKEEKKKMEEEAESEEEARSDDEDYDEEGTAEDEENEAYAEYTHFKDWPRLSVERDCDICDDSIHGPYIRCNKCSDGDFDMCQDCLFQGFGCEDEDHKWLKKYPKRLCDPCGQMIQGWYWHCAICNDGYNICQTCGEENNQECFDQPDHDYALIYIPSRN